jgi:hypothetical protein
MAVLEMPYSAPNNLDDSLHRPEPQHFCGHHPAKQPLQYQFQLSRREGRRWAVATHLHRCAPRAGRPTAVGGRNWRCTSDAVPPA